MKTKIKIKQLFPLAENMKAKLILITIFIFINDIYKESFKYKDC